MKYIWNEKKQVVHLLNTKFSKNSSKNLNLNFTLMYTPIQLEAIKLFGRKDLTEGCVSIEKDWTLWKCDVREEWRTINLPEWQRNVTSSEIEWEILWSEPHLFPDVAKKLREKGYNLEVLQWDTLTSIIRISRWDIKKPQIIEYKPCLPLLEQPQAMEQLLSLTK